MARSSENFTSSAVSGDPSLNLTPSRKVMRNCLGLTCSHLAASDGSAFWVWLLYSTSASYTARCTELLTPTFWAWMSQDDRSAERVQRKVDAWAVTAAIARVPASARAVTNWVGRDRDVKDGVYRITISLLNGAKMNAALSQHLHPMPTNLWFYRYGARCTWGSLSASAARGPGRR